MSRRRSMLPDVVDDFASKHPSCKGLEPLFFSCYAFCSKLAGSLSAGISTMMLQSVDLLSSRGESLIVPSRPLLPPSCA